MNIAIWVVQGLLAIAFLGAGMMKLMRSREQLIEGGMGFVEDAPMHIVRIIGALEVAGAIGLILPWLSGILPILTPLAAVGLILTMIGAAIVHIRRGEYSRVVPPLVLLALAAFVAYGRFVIVPFETLA